MPTPISLGPWNPNQPVGSRIIRVEVRNADGTYSPIDLEATYNVAANDFIRNGGDDYEVFVNARNAYDFGASLDEAVQAYIVVHSPVAPQLEGRITQEEGASTALLLPETGGVGGGLLPLFILSVAGIGLTGVGLWLRRKK